jgi:hypothetical protein
MSKLARTLSLSSACALLIGGIIGSGIFATPGLAWKTDLHRRLNELSSRPVRLVGIAGWVLLAAASGFCIISVHKHGRIVLSLIAGSVLVHTKSAGLSLVAWIVAGVFERISRY